MRLAIPRRVYTQSHVDYLIEVMLHVWGLRERVRGVRIVEQPAALRHFLGAVHAGLPFPGGRPVAGGVSRWR